MNSFPEREATEKESVEKRDFPSIRRRHSEISQRQAREDIDHPVGEGQQFLRSADDKYTKIGRNDGQEADADEDGLATKPASDR